MNTIDAIQKRRSIRKFTDQPVPREMIKRILQAGIDAPSAKNRQPWRFVVVQNPEKRAIFEKASFGQEHVRKAPVIIACCSTNTEYRMPNGQLSYPIDISFAASQMVFQAVHEGLGTCIVTTFDETDLQEILTLPYSMRVVLLLLVGYSSEASTFQDRLPFERVVSYEHW